MTNPLTRLHRLDAGGRVSYTLIRAFLGFALFVRGWIFIGDQEVLMRLIVDSGVDWFMPAFLVHYITLAHLVGGLMLILGLLTRAAALAQIPILIGAVFFVHWQEGLFAAGQSLELATLVLFLLVIVFLFGPGTLSLDYHFFRRKAPSPTLPATGDSLPLDGIIRPHGTHPEWERTET